MSDRTPPNDEQAEQAALHAALSLGRIPEPLKQLRPADFYKPTHETIWASVIWLQDHGDPCDANAVLARLMETKHSNEVQLLPELVTYSWVSDPEHLAEIILDRAGRRHIIEAATRTLQSAYESDHPYEAQLQRAEAELAKVPTRDTGNVDSLHTLAEFLGEQMPEPEWVMDGYLARGERLIITGLEGLGKTTWVRQMAVCTAAGMDPFTGARRPPRTVLAIDAENPRFIMQKRYDELIKAVAAHGVTVAEDRFWMDERPEGLDLSDPADVRWLEHRVRITNPDLLVIGPAYKLHTAGNEDRDETIARTVTGVLDRIRAEANCALILEHHAGNEQGGGVRPVRPYGSSLWRRWPEFGFGIRPAKHEQAEQRRIVEVVSWRGARDERAWPRHMESGGDGMPWVETVIDFKRGAA